MILSLLECREDIWSTAVETLSTAIPESRCSFLGCLTDFNCLYGCIIVWQLRDRQPRLRETCPRELSKTIITSTEEIIRGSRYVEGIEHQAKVETKP